MANGNYTKPRLLPSNCQTTNEVDFCPQCCITLVSNSCSLVLVYLTVCNVKRDEQICIEKNVIPASERRTTKSRRISRACDYCHQRSIRCINAGGSQCQKCIEFDQPCTYERAVKKRGVKPKSEARAGLAPVPRNFEFANRALD